MAETRPLQKTELADNTDADIDAQVSELLAQVGVRVRQAREFKGIPRRVLSDISGVSPRYLAQLEAGQGNISIGLLKRVAVALDTGVEWFLGGADERDADASRVARMYLDADASTRLAVLRALGTAPVSSRAQRICLVGLRGAGKSTLGRRAALELKLPFLELNEEIAGYGGMPIEEIMALYGQEGYRTLEASSLERVIETHDRVILAVAGGIVAEPRTYARLLANFHTIWIKAAPEEHMERVRAQGDERPMAGNPDAMDQLKSILRSRESSYARAEAELDTSGNSVQASLSSLVQLIADHRFLGHPTR